MLIPLKEAIQQHDLKIRGIVHVGAHWGQELEAYHDNGIFDIVFIEPCVPAFRVLQEKLAGDSQVLLFNCACGEQEEKVPMHIETRNQGQSNSLLAPKIHLERYPEIVFPNTEIVQVKPLDDLDFHRRFYNLLMMDTQGAELMVLKGATKTLEAIDYIYTEVNNKELYAGNAMVDDLDSYLLDFQRVQTHWVADHGWGDAIYVRKSLLKK